MTGNLWFMFQYFYDSYIIKVIVVNLDWIEKTRSVPRVLVDNSFEKPLFTKQEDK